ncbi:glycosyltransferase [Candidatus Collierbacteria bacterium]|nr:glycosyltransferase [Candidatus Collierbacteria bacterium]
MKSKTVVFTGGHHNSSLVVAKALKKEGYQLVWFGRKFGSGGDKSLSAEYQEVSATGIQFIELKAGKFYKKYSLIEFIKILFGFIQSLVYLIKFKPALIVSFGGYLAVPVVISGWLLGIPSVTHEQTVTAGWANKAISPFVKKILLTHNSSLKNYPVGKSLVVGLPIRPELFDSKLTKRFKPKLLYISCGKQGSHKVNQALFPLIPSLVKHFTIIHQTGANTLTKDNDKARRVKESLGKYQHHYVFAPYFFTREAATYLKSASYIISRAGAHLTYELLLLKKHTLFIPIAWASHNEQLLNAKLAKKYLPSVILEEKNLNPENLAKSLAELSNLKPTSKTINLPTDATSRILKVIYQYL